MAAAALATIALPAWTTLAVDDFYSNLHAGFFHVPVDRRDTHEWSAGHIPNATFMRYRQIDQNADAIAGFKHCNVGVYCNSGVLSKVAATALANLGFTSVYDAQGIV